MFLRNNLVSHKSFRPDFIASSVADINFEWLKSHGAKALLIDLDGTVVFRGKYDVTANISKALKTQPLDIYIATNRPQSRDLKNLREQLHAQGVVHPRGLWGKPTTQYYKNAMKSLHLKANQLVMVGDRYIQDIYGANRAGLTTVLVRKIDEPVNRVDSLISNFEGRRTKRLTDQYQTL